MKRFISALLPVGLFLLWDVDFTSAEDQPHWQDAPIVGLGPVGNGMVGRVIAVPDAKGGIWRLDTVTGMVSRCWHRSDNTELLEPVEPAGPWENYSDEYQKVPLCSAWTEQ